MSENKSITLYPEYDIITSKCDVLRDELLEAINAGTTGITVDLKQVSIVDSSGLSVLISAHNTLKKTGEKLNLTNVSENIQKLLAITRLDKHFGISNS